MASRRTVAGDRRLLFRHVALDSAFPDCGSATLLSSRLLAISMNVRRKSNVAPATTSSLQRKRGSAYASTSRRVQAHGNQRGMAPAGIEHAEASRGILQEPGLMRCPVSDPIVDGFNVIDDIY